MVCQFCYSSLKDFGTSGSKKKNMQNVATPPATLVAVPDTAFIKNFIDIPPFYYVDYIRINFLNEKFIIYNSINVIPYTTCPDIYQVP